MDATKNTLLKMFLELEKVDPILRTSEFEMVLDNTKIKYILNNN